MKDRKVQNQENTASLKKGEHRYLNLLLMKSGNIQIVKLLFVKNLVEYGMIRDLNLIMPI